MVEKRGEADASIVNKLVLKKAVDHRIATITAKAFISEREVYELVRGFFKKYLGIDYEFTSEELVYELKKVYVAPEFQERIRLLLDRISEMEHLSRAFEKEELQSVLADFKSLVDGLIGAHYENKGFFRKLGDSFKGSAQDHRKMLNEATMLNENERIIVKMNMLLDNSRRWANKDVAAAKQAYDELLHLYNALDDERKTAYFKPINELYSILRNKGIS